MGASVLHYGDDDCHRISVLESAGFKVERCASLVQLASALKSEPIAEAVIVIEGPRSVAQEAASVARKRSSLPVVLFRTYVNAEPAGDYDLVVPTLTAPGEWLRRVRGLIETGRGSRTER